MSMCRVASGIGALMLTQYIHTGYIVNGHSRTVIVRRERFHQNDKDRRMIQLQGVSKIFYTDDVETHALQRVDLEIERGEFVSIAGPSGCGKSTLLSIVGLLESPTTGSYALGGKP